MLEIQKMLRDMVPNSAVIGHRTITDRHNHYVYMLRKPDGVPFYVGKGRNNRINAHFSPYSLQQDSLKNRTILKHGVDNCYREIVTFCEEDAAFELERFLMEEIGCLLDKTGPLTNVDIPIEGPYRHLTSGGMTYAAPKKKFSDDVIFKFYVMEFELCLPRTLIVEELGIDRNYQLTLARGESRRDLYRKYVESGVITNKKSVLDYVPRVPAKRSKESDERLLEEYEHVINGRKTVFEASENLELGYSSVIRIFRGQARKHLGLNYRRDLKVPLKGNTRVYDREKALRLIRQGISKKEFVKEMNCSPEYFYYVRNVFREYGVINDDT